MEDTPSSAHRYTVVDVSELSFFMLVSVGSWRARSLALADFKRAATDEEGVALLLLFLLSSTSRTASIMQSLISLYWTKNSTARRLFDSTCLVFSLGIFVAGSKGAVVRAERGVSA